MRESDPSGSGARSGSASVSHLDSAPESAVVPLRSPALRAGCADAPLAESGQDLEQIGLSHYLEAALAHVTDAVITSDHRGVVTYLNAAAESLTGHARATAIGQPLTSVLPLVDAGSGSAIDATVDGASQLDAEALPRTAVLLKGADRPIIIEYRVTLLRDVRGAALGAVTVFRDVSRGKRDFQTSEAALIENAEALFEEKERAQVTLNSIGDGVLSTDFRSRISFLNNIAERMTGLTQAEAAGQLLVRALLIVDTKTHDPARLPAIMAIIENRTVRTYAQCVLIHRDGTESAVEVSASPIHDKQGGVIGAVVVLHDVTEARDLTAKLARLALHDSLTGLPNRTLLADRLENALQRAQRSGNSVSLLFVDLDRFKSVNDSRGHGVGDRLLTAVADRLRSCVRSTDTVSRHGGDEFIILLPDIADGDDSVLCADKILTALDAPFDIGEQCLKIGASIGIATSDQGLIDAATLMQNADHAMYQAKLAGRRTFRLFR